MRTLLPFLLTSLLILSGPVQARTLLDMEFPEVIAATDSSPELHLLGASVRRIYGMVETYVGLLYVADKDLQASSLPEADVARRMVFHVTSSRVSTRRFANAMEEGLVVNVSEAEMQQLAGRIQDLLRMFDHKFTNGTVGYIEWVPSEQHSRIVLDGELRGTIPGKDMNDAILKIWIGERPVSERFKREVLGITASADQQ